MQVYEHAVSFFDVPFDYWFFAASSTEAHGDFIFNPLALITLLVGLNRGEEWVVFLLQL